MEILLNNQIVKRRRFGEVWMTHALKRLYIDEDLR